MLCSSDSSSSSSSSERCSSQVEVVNDERLLEALPLSYLSLLLTGDFHPCPSALLSTLPPFFPHCAPPGKRSISPPLAHLSALCSLFEDAPHSCSCAAAVITACTRLLFGFYRLESNETLGPPVNLQCFLVRGWPGVGGFIHRMPSGNHVTVPWEN